ncbi:isochorismatase family protein [Nonomuraea sp. CA-141351]|uniref:isochorismatase family protein n=1 Tax=Nonomuraea sp. CA-141351 TaxID=3239996 RepID=UPI003D8B603B
MTSSFTKDNMALLLVDHQTAVMDRLVKVPPPEAVKANAVALARAARRFGVPIVLSCSAEQHNGRLIPELEKAAPDEYRERIERQTTVDAFADPRVSAAVRATGRTQLVVAGVGSEVCGFNTALGARREGYDVQFAVDACGTLTEFYHDIVLRRLESEGVRLATTPMILSGLVTSFGGADGLEIVRILAEAGRTGR